MRDSRVALRRLQALEDAVAAIREEFVATNVGNMGALFTDRISVDVTACCSWEEGEAPSAPVWMGVVQVYEALQKLAEQTRDMAHHFEMHDLEDHQRGELVEWERAV